MSFGTECLLPRLIYQHFLITRRFVVTGISSLIGRTKLLGSIIFITSVVAAHNSRMDARLLNHTFRQAQTHPIDLSKLAGL